MLKFEEEMFVLMEDWKPCAGTLFPPRKGSDYSLLAIIAMFLFLATIAGTLAGTRAMPGTGPNNDWEEVRDVAGTLTLAPSVGMLFTDCILDKKFVN